MEWLHDAEDFSSSPGSLVGDESGSEIEELPVPLHHRHQNETPPPSFDSPELLASYVGSPLREHHGQALAFFDAADCPQTDEDDFADSDPDEGAESDAGTEGPADAQTSAIAEIFRCFICLGKVVEAQLCPCCSKICCFRCIKRWLTDQRPQCPHCRASLRVSQLVNCRFIADLSSELEKLQKKGLSETPEKACSLHNSPMSYYCNTCSDAVCSDCAVFGEEHRGHSFERLLAVYERHVETIRGEAVGLRRRLKDLCALVSEKDKNIERVHKAKDEAGMKLQLAFEGMQARLEQQLKSKLLTLLAQKGSMTQEIEGLDSMMHDLNGQLNSVPKGELIARSTSICSMLQEVQQRPTSDLNRTPVPADFISEVVPPYDQGEFVLHDFERVLRRTTAIVNPNPSPRGVTSARTVEPMHGSNAAVNPSEDTSDGAGVVYSQPIQAAGIIWRLKVYPNGNGVAAGSYLSVFLEMVQGGSEPAKYEYKIEMLHRTRPHQSVIREFASVFEVGECWGYNRFFRLEVLKEEGYLLPEEDVITLRFHVRAPTYAQQCQDLRRALVTMEDEKSDAQKQADVLRRAFADTLWWKRRRKMPSNQRETAGASGAEKQPAPEHDVSSDKSDVIIEQSDGETEASHKKRSVQRAGHNGKSTSGRKKGRGSGKQSREKLEERGDQVSGQCRLEVAQDLLITQERAQKAVEAEPSIVETDEEYVEASEPFSEEVWVPETAQESTDVRAPIRSESHSIGERLESSGAAAKWQPLAKGNETDIRNQQESRMELVDCSRTVNFVSAPATLAGGKGASATDVDRAEPANEEKSDSRPGPEASIVGRRASETADSGEISTPDQGASEDSKQETAAGTQPETTAQQPFFESQEAGQPSGASREGSERRMRLVLTKKQDTPEDLEGIIKMCLAPNTFKRFGLSDAQADREQQLRRIRGDAYASGESEVSSSIEERVSSHNESNDFRVFISDSEVAVEESERRSNEIDGQNTDRVCAESEGETSSSANVQRGLEGGCTAATSASDVLQKEAESTSENDSDGGKENVRKGDLTQLRLAARSPCFMERVAKVSLVDGKSETTCTLSRPPLLKSGLGVKPLGAELKSRLRSETRPFVRSRERKTDESRVTSQSEDATSVSEEGRKDEEGHLGKLQFWHNNPFIKLPKVEPFEAGPAGEECQTSDNPGPALDRSLPSLISLKLDVNSDNMPSNSVIRTITQGDGESGERLQRREPVEQLPAVDA